MRHPPWVLDASFFLHYRVNWILLKGFPGDALLKIMEPEKCVTSSSIPPSPNTVVPLLTHGCMSWNEAFVFPWPFVMHWIDAACHERLGLFASARCHGRRGKKGFSRCASDVGFRAPAGTYWPWRAFGRAVDKQLLMARRSPRNWV